ncbi:hypothetical protein AAMO2058_001193800 [Amorphochlora amoebiformis]
MAIQKGWGWDERKKGIFLEFFFFLAFNFSSSFCVLFLIYLFLICFIFLNSAFSKKALLLRHGKHGNDKKETPEVMNNKLDFVESEIIRLTNHVELLGGALVEIIESDVEVKILGFPVTESVLAQLAALMGTGISAISAKLSTEQNN